jgi:hypothetical protein
MTPPHSEVIFAAVLEALKRIRQTDGYYTTPKQVQRYDRNDVSELERPSLTLRRPGEAKNVRGATWDCDLTFEVEGVISAADDVLEGQGTDELTAYLQDDIERALAGIGWEALQAYLNRISVVQIIDLDPNDPEDGIVVTVGINYAHDVSSTRAPLAI